MNFTRNYRISITKLKLTHVNILNYIKVQKTVLISTRVTHGHDSTHIKPNKNMA
jgi:hypothetical protein